MADETAAPPGFTPRTQAPPSGFTLRRPTPVSPDEWFLQTFGRPPIIEPGSSRNENAAELRWQQDPEGMQAWEAAQRERLGAAEPPRFTTLGEGVPAPPPYVSDTTGQRLRMGAQGLTFGLSDEIAGVVGGIGSLLRGEGWQPGYDTNVTHEREQMEGFRQFHPAEAGFAEIAGALPLALIPGLGISRAVTLPGKLAAGIGGGGATAGAYGFGTAEGSPLERLPEAGRAALWGAGIGAAAPVVAPVVAPLVARGIGAAARGFGAAVPAREAPAVSILARNLNAEPTDILAAGNLIREGQARGVALTWPEALAQVTSGRVNTTGLQRVVEQSRGGNQIMSTFMADRPGQVQAAMAAEAPRVGPLVEPVTLGSTIQRLSQDEISGLQNSINMVTKDLYDAAAPVQVAVPRGTTPTVDPAGFNALYRDPVFQRALQAIRSDPVYSRTLSAYPDDAVAVLDTVKKWLDDQSGSASRAGENYRSSVFGGVARDTRNMARNASTEYGDALDTQALLRRTDLVPLQQGPIGTMVETSNLGQQANALFASAPFEGMERAVKDAVSRLASADPIAASALVRQHITRTFNEATQALQSGPNQFGGASAVSQLLGNPQQAKNLEAAVRALPNGDARWEGFRKLMDVLETTGRRQTANSATAFNQAMQEELRRGQGIANLATLASSPTEAAGAIRRWYNDLRLGRNTEAFARIITDPASEKLLLRLAQGGSGAQLEPVVLALLQTANVTATPRIALPASSQPFVSPVLPQLVPALP